MSFCTYVMFIDLDPAHSLGTNHKTDSSFFFVRLQGHRVCGPRQTWNLISLRIFAWARRTDFGNESTSPLKGWPFQHSGLPDGNLDQKHSHLTQSSDVCFPDFTRCNLKGFWWTSQYPYLYWDGFFPLRNLKGPFTASSDNTDEPCNLAQRGLPQPPFQNRKRCHQKHPTAKQDLLEATKQPLNCRDQNTL